MTKDELPMFDSYKQLFLVLIKSLEPKKRKKRSKKLLCCGCLEGDEYRFVNEVKWRCACDCHKEPKT